MRVTVHESGHHHAPGGFDLARIAGGGQFFDAVRGTGIHDHAILYQHSAVLYDTEIAQCRAAPRTPIAAQSE
jgi:hypothetical protein